MQAFYVILSLCVQLEKAIRIFDIIFFSIFFLRLMFFSYGVTSSKVFLRTANCVCIFQMAHVSLET